jgi:large subunit ribosomal protein L6
VSRIGKKPVTITSGVKIVPSKTDLGTRVAVEGPKGKLAYQFRPVVGFELKDKEVVITRAGEDAFSRAYHGTARALLQNMVVGVSKGFEKRLQIVGVGYNAKLQGKKLVLSIGFCHSVELMVPEGIQIQVPVPTEIVIQGPDRQAVGQFAAVVRGVRPPEPYKGKGIKYSDEIIVRKAGKAQGSSD